jgi:hypothetical protein
MPAEPVLAPEVQGEPGPIVADLRTAGWTVTASRYDEQHFGNWYVDLMRDGQSFRLLKDRSQFIIDGPFEELKAAGLFKAFDALGAFRQAVVTSRCYLGDPGPAHNPSPKRTAAGRSAFIILHSAFILQPSSSIL